MPIILLIFPLKRRNLVELESSWLKEGLGFERHGSGTERFKRSYVKKVVGEDVYWNMRKRLFGIWCDERNVQQISGVIKKFKEENC